MAGSCEHGNEPLDFVIAGSSSATRASICISKMTPFHGVHLYSFSFSGHYFASMTLSYVWSWAFTATMDMKSSRATSRVKWLKHEETNVSRSISVLVLRVLKSSETLSYFTARINFRCLERENKWAMSPSGFEKVPFVIYYRLFSASALAVAHLTDNVFCPADSKSPVGSHVSPWQVSLSPETFCKQRHVRKHLLIFTVTTSINESNLSRKLQD
jgi:hypothetical protein